MSWKFTDECDCYCNHHETFHIAQNGLTEEKVQKELENIFGTDDDTVFVADGGVNEYGAWFSTAKEDIAVITRKLSNAFPDAIVFGQDCWDYEGYVVCLKNGRYCYDYETRIDELELNTDDTDYYEFESTVKAPNGYEFCVGGGMVDKKEVWYFTTEFILDGKYDPENSYIKKIMAH